MDRRYALFLGCTVPVRALNYEMAARRVAEGLDVELVDIGDFECCGFPVKSVDHEAYLLMAARNLSLAEAQGLDVCCLCSACTSSLTEAHHTLKEDETLRGRINEELRGIGQAFQGAIEVKHFARILYEDVGMEEIEGKITRSLEGYRVAAHHGCHYVRPSEIYGGFDRPEHPQTLNRLVEATGAEVVQYERTEQCCGGGILGIDESASLQMAKGKLDRIKAAGADAMTVICPFCDVMYEANQKSIEMRFGAEYKLPVLFYPQILGFAMGMDPKAVGMNMNRVKATELMNRGKD